MIDRASQALGYGTSQSAYNVIGATTSPTSMA